MKDSIFSLSGSAIRMITFNTFHVTDGIIKARVLYVLDMDNDTVRVCPKDTEDIMPLHALNEMRGGRPGEILLLHPGDCDYAKAKNQATYYQRGVHTMYCKGAVIRIAATKESCGQCSLPRHLCPQPCLLP